MPSLIIIGAGGFGRVLLAQCRNDAGNGKDWTLGGFLDDRPDILAGYKTDVPIIGSPFTYEPRPDDYFICAQGDPVSKRKYSAALIEKNAIFINLRTYVFQGDNVVMGRGNVFEPHVTLASDCIITDFVTIGAQTIIGHDVRIGSYSHVSSFVFIGGRVTVGEAVTIHPHATILPKVKIGDGAVIGAGSVVMGNVPAYTTVMGNPARKFEFK
jgi:sugar O-acyltransferase (sialic acid O-acetyltransferase NeuD family)